MNKTLKISLIGLLSLALMVGMTGGANAALTLGATTIVSGGALTIDGAAASAITIGDAAQTGAINIGTSSATLSALNLANGAGATTVNIALNDTVADDINIGSAKDDVDITGASSIVAGTTDPLTITGNAASTWSTSAGALTITSKAAAVWSTHTGDLTVEAGTTSPGSLYLLSDESAQDSIALISTIGGIDITATGATAGEDIDIVATGSSVNISSTEDDTAAIVISTTQGGIDIAATGVAADDIDIAGTLTSVNVTSTEDAANAIKLYANGGTSETIKVHSDQGTALTSIGLLSDDGGIQIAATTNATESTTAGAIEIAADAGSISLNAVKNSGWNVSGGTLTLANTSNEADAIKLHADSGASQTIVLLNDAGTAEGAITLTSTAGGVDIDAAAGKDVAITGGQITLLSSHDTASSISLTTGAGTSETLVITNTAGTAAGAVTIAATGGTTGTILINADGTGTDAVDIDAVGGVDIDAGAVVAITTSNDELQIDTGTADVVIAGNAIGTDALTLTAGDITLTAGDVDLTAGRLIMGTETGGTCSGGLVIDLSSKTKGILTTIGDVNNACAISFTNGTAGELVVLSHNYGGTGVVTFADVTGFDAAWTPVASTCSGIDADVTAANLDHFYIIGVMTSDTEIMILGCQYFDAA